MIAAAGVRDAATWSLFVDWCTGTRRCSLPAGPIDVAQFLADTPAAAATQRRRVSVINAVHRRAGLPPPGDAERVRAVLDRARCARMADRRHAARAALGGVGYGPGPLAELLARRDRMVLLLHAAGKRHSQVATLKCGDVEVADTGVHVWVRSGADVVDLTEVTTDATAIAAAWLGVRAVQSRAPSARATFAFLEGRSRLAPGWPPSGLALFTPLDRWGEPPLADAGMSAAAVGVIVSSWMHGIAPRRTSPPGNVTSPGPAEDAPSDVSPAEVPRGSRQQLAPESFDRGLEARRRAIVSLETVAGTLDAVEDRADALLESLALLLDGV